MAREWWKKEMAMQTTSNKIQFYNTISQHDIPKYFLKKLCRIILGWFCSMRYSFIQGGHRIMWEVLSLQADNLVDEMQYYTIWCTCTMKPAVSIASEKADKIGIRRNFDAVLKEKINLRTLPQVSMRTFC